MAKEFNRAGKPGSQDKKGSRPRSPLPKTGGRPAARSKAAPKSKHFRLLRKISIPNERKMDILGIFLTLIGLITLLSLISRTQGTVTEGWIKFLTGVAGWGTFVLPLALIIVGVWLVLRRVEKLPGLSFARLLGMILLYFNILAFFDLFTTSGGKAFVEGTGGGSIGAFFNRSLVSGIGTAGTVVLLVAWLLVALALTFDVSIPDLVRFFSPLYQRLRALLNRARAKPKPAPKNLAASEEASDDSSLPPDFRPMQPKRDLKPVPQPASTPSGKAEKAPAAGRLPGAADSASPGANAQPQTPWVLPPVDAILDPATVAAQTANVDQDRKKIIEETLASFGAPVHVVDISHGPTITQFGVEPDFLETRGGGKMRVRVSKIVSLSDDLALALAAPRIRIQAPVPGRNYVGIEVPNTEISRVTLREVVESENFKKTKGQLRLAIGKDVSGKTVAYELSAMPHLLIAGTTGSGKSVCVNSILCCLLMNNIPSDLRLVLVDPKRVELTNYNGLPHLLAPVVVDAERVVGALQWMQREMDSRYQKFMRAGVRNIQEYNACNGNGDHLAYLVVIIDELADLMMISPEETERSITRLGQLARATGIHLILATQRPSVDVVTGLIKANLPARIAFTVASQIDSRVILDRPGAERLLGRGDMLFQAPDSPAPARLQGVYVSDSEIQRLVDYWKLQAAQVKAAPTIEGGPVDAVPLGVPLKQTPLWDDMAFSEPTDPLLDEAIDLVRKEGRASITMLQRRMRIGYTRAARLVDVLETRKIIAPPQANSQVREVLDYGPAGPPPED